MRDKFEGAKNTLKYGIAAGGRREMQKHVAGERLTRNEAIKAKCYSCCEGYTEGKFDCLDPGCPLYPYSHYKGKQPPSDGSDA